MAKILKQQLEKIIGEFKNEFGELFVVYEIGGAYYITGDEFEWEDNWLLRRWLFPNSFACAYLATRVNELDAFTISMEESIQVHKIMHPIVDKRKPS